MYRHIFEPTLGMQRTTTIAPFMHSGNGRGAHLALNSQLMVTARWDQYIKDKMNFLVNQKWTGNVGFSLKYVLNQNRASYTMLLNQHYESYTMLQRCTEHVQQQFPDTRQIVKWILDKIYFEDSDVRAAIIQSVWMTHQTS